jgi:hypothetical protein
MYIGPWQEFKLAKILQLKDVVEKEEKSANHLDSSSNHKAFSVGANALGKNGRQQAFGTHGFQGGQPGQMSV